MTYVFCISNAKISYMWRADGASVRPSTENWWIFAQWRFKAYIQGSKFHSHGSFAPYRCTFFWETRIIARMIGTLILSRTSIFSLLVNSFIRIRNREIEYCFRWYIAPGIWKWGQSCPRTERGHRTIKTWAWSPSVILYPRTPLPRSNYTAACSCSGPVLT